MSTYRDVLYAVMQRRIRHPNDQTDAEIAAGITPTDYSYLPYHAMRYGADPTGAVDSTAAIQAAVDSAEATGGYNSTVTLPHGKLRIDGTVTCKQGTMIVGLGSQGSTLGYGTSIDHRSTGDCFVWNPQTGAVNAGTGGGLKNVVIVKASGVSGGRAIYVVNFDNDHRCGEMIFENVLIYGTGTGMWNKGVFIDGLLTNTPGARGVRSVHFNKVRVTTCSSNNQYVHLTQCVHAKGDISVDNAGGSGTTGMTIDGFWENIDLHLRVGGNLVVNHDGTPGTDFPSLNLAGATDVLDVNYQSTVGTVTMMVGSSITSNAKGLRISSNHADAFFAYKTSTQENQTGNGTVYTVVYDAESYDQNTSLIHTTGIATIKCAGLHEFKAQVTINGLTALHTLAALALVHLDSGASTVNSVENLINIGAVRSVGNQASMDISAILNCDEGDTVKVRLTISNGGADDADIAGSAGTRYTRFSGKLLS